MLLSPCPSCSRHVRVSEAGCPFCSARLPVERAVVPAAPHRLARAAAFAFTATLTASAAFVAAGSVEGCSSSTDEKQNADTGTNAAAYGAPPADAASTDGAASDSGATDALPDNGGIGPAYGAAADM